MFAAVNLGWVFVNAAVVCRLLFLTETIHLTHKTLLYLLAQVQEHVSVWCTVGSFCCQRVRAES